MTKAQHTPGPWSQSDSNPHLIFKDVQGCIDVNQPVAMCQKTVKGRANARLIAAAPELLAECEWALDLLTDQYGLDDSCEGVAALRAVIAKARGEA